jgi:hypothetical protein
VAAPTIAVADDIVTEKQKYLPDRFECVACNLKIHDFSKLSAAGLGDQFTSTQDYDLYSYFAANLEQYDDYEPDYNE